MNPPPESLELADDARAPDAESGHLDIAPAAELPLLDERLTLPPTERSHPPGRHPDRGPGGAPATPRGR